MYVGRRINTSQHEQAAEQLKRVQQTHLQRAKVGTPFVETKKKPRAAVQLRSKSGRAQAIASALNRQRRTGERAGCPEGVCPTRDGRETGRRGFRPRAARGARINRSTESNGRARQPKSAGKSSQLNKDNSLRNKNGKPPGR
jgi:hypothetical protein